ncbi:MAG: copper chaperone PCu(A)C [Alphaproteobacteria bacterium]
MTLPSLQTMAHDYSAGRLAIAHPWAPPTLGKQRTGVIYFTIHNRGEQAERLLGIDLPEGGHAMMHSSEIQDGVMRMRPVDALKIPAQAEVALLPGGMHVMLTDLPGPLIEGGRLKFRLHFEIAGPVEVEAAIEPRGSTASAPPPQHHQH